MNKILTVGVLLLLILRVSPIYSQTTAPGTEQGTKIGNVIKAIITTALPPVQLLLDAIWPKKKDNKTDVEQTDKNKLEAKLASYQESLKLKITKDVNIANALAEVNAIKNFLIPTNKIQDFLRSINPLIGGDSLNSDNWIMAKEYWNTVKEQITKTRSIALDDASPFLKETLKSIAYTDKTDIDKISIEYFNRDLNYINDKTTNRLPKLRDKISTLLEIYQQVPSLMVTYFDCLKIDIINSQTEINNTINKTGENKIATTESIDEIPTRITLMRMGVKSEVDNINNKIKKSQGKLK
ncbi:MAG: hypothetical protein NTZ12_11465 [Candidatus Aminicenantes bacterium]|nr:hypothetical protein [Candidatus Aminicenantes bacterium]